MSDHDFDVAIVGYGPVGACAALQLAHAGLRVLILERTPELYPLPRAVGLDGESVRAFQRLGFGDEVAATLQPPRDPNEVCFTDSKHTRLFGQEIPAMGWNGWPEVSFFDQPELEALLRERVESTEGIRVAVGHDVVAIEQDERAVWLRSRTSAAGEERTHRAAYVIGCDGASSFVRRAIGIGWQSLGYDQDWLVIDITIGPEADLPLSTMQVCDPERLTTYVCPKDPNRRWEFQLLPGETREEMLEPERIHALLDPWLPREHYVLRRKAVYQFHAATADRWRVGRVFLAGDAAHQTPPFLGQGLNAGFRDAVNLGWKLPLVLSGACDESLLDSYAVERDAHARDLVDWAVQIGKLMETLAAREAGLPDPHPAVDGSAGYGQGRSAPPLRDGVLIASQVEGAAATGMPLRQPMVARGATEPFRLDALLGEGFTIVARTHADTAVGPESRTILDRLGGATVALEGLTATSGKLDGLLGEAPAAVVRPDRYVFGVVDRDWSLDALVAELGRKLGLRR